MNQIIRGWNDCEKGEPEDPNGNSEYVRGYRLRYDWEQILTAQSEIYENR